MQPTIKLIASCRLHKRYRPKCFELANDADPSRWRRIIDCIDRSFQITDGRAYSQAYCCAAGLGSAIARHGDVLVTSCNSCSAAV